MNNILMALYNPQAFIQQVQNSPMMQDPRAKRTIQLMQNGDTNGLKTMAENLCREYGTTPEQMRNDMMKNAFFNKPN